ncbi:MAG: tRNA uridine-5-carboxymethylaminomethyl(34) synthesis GTPase MnmE [Rikenellaceae bacterium]
MNTDQTIVAPATGVGGAIAIIRVSGQDALKICDEIFFAKKQSKLTQVKGYTMHFGEIKDKDEVIDEVITSVFRAPHSYTGENMVEISCHGSNYIKNRIINLLIEKGARSAQAGEFTIRAFLNAKLDLSQAEAVADIIASENKASHTMAIRQIKGSYSQEFTHLREQLVELVSLLELELDFGEEDVEFADRAKLAGLLSKIEKRIQELLSSFTLGNSLKQGVPVALIGKPNAGKSTLLNALIGEDRAMVSDIEGTTRDSIEESLNISGVNFRFIDTAGLRHTDDKLEAMGIERTKASINKANIILVLHDATEPLSQSEELISELNISDDRKVCLIINKCDKLKGIKLEKGQENQIHISAKEHQGIEEIKDFLIKTINLEPLTSGDTIVSSTRHYHALLRAQESLERAHAAMQDNLPADLLSQDIKETLHFLGEITGEITTDDILGSIFTKFCIGK